MIARRSSYYCPAPDCPERGFPVPTLERVRAGRWMPDAGWPSCHHCGTLLKREPEPYQDHHTSTVEGAAAWEEHYGPRRGPPYADLEEDPPDE